MSRYRFGTFAFDSDAVELRRDGTPVRLQAQPAQVLSVLLQQAGEIVTRDTLQQTIWSDGTQVDFERGLNYCIAQVRSALGDSADSPRFVKTIPKKGYQFIAPVEAVPAATPIGAKPKPVRWPWLAAAAGVVLAAIALWSFTTYSGDTRPIVAVCLFENQTGEPELDRIAAGFSDSLTAELAAAGASQVQVIGNAAVLRKPRTEQNLGLVHLQLGAEYIVVGQLQKDATGVRVLAHLLKMPKQTHVTVARLESAQLDKPLQTQAEFAQLATKRFLKALQQMPHIDPQPAH